MASIKDVAAQAGVSPTTVSHAISGKRKVSDEIVQKVRFAMRELNYAPSRSAQSLASGHTRIIALIIPDIGNSFFAELAKGVEQAAMESGYNVILCTTGFDHAREILYLEMIRSRAVDGVVYAAGSPPTNSELVRLLGDLPVVLVDEEIPDAEATIFVSDNLLGGRLAAEHLLAFGHRDCLILSTNDDLVSGEQRVAGFREAWMAGGGNSPSMASGGFTERGAIAAILPLIGSQTKRNFTAVFAVNDLMAIGAIQALVKAGVSVPNDVSVIGFDDITASRYIHPSLTTIRQEVETLGSIAARALVADLEGTSKLDGTRHVLPVELMARDSTAPAAFITIEGDI